jgi:hypothetical protein
MALHVHCSEYWFSLGPKIRLNSYRETITAPDTAQGKPLAADTFFQRVHQVPIVNSKWFDPRPKDLNEFPNFWDVSSKAVFQEENAVHR